jgi:hypothetical protein
MKKVSFFLVILLAFSGCSQKKNTSQQQAAKEDTTHYFEVAHYIQKQIEDVKKTPYYIYKIEVINGLKDSTPINTPIFIDLAQNFIRADINKSTSLKRNYIENIFHDETTKTFTISYTTPNKDLEVQNIEVLLQEDGQTLKRIFIRKFLNYNDSSAIEQLSWKADEGFQINRLVQMADKKEISRQVSVVWNPKS